MEEEEDERPRRAIVGKKYVEKSSIINKLLEKKHVVSNIAGNDRDAIDTDIVYNGRNMYSRTTRRPSPRGKNKMKKNWNATALLSRMVTAVEAGSI